MKQSLLFSLFMCISLISFTQEKLSVYFSFNSSVLNSEEEQKIRNLIQTSKVQVSKIVAYTDTFGTKNFNQNLAKKRLKSVVKLLEIENLKNTTKEVLGENYTGNNETVNDYKAWRRVDLFYTSGPFNEPEVHLIEGTIEPEIQKSNTISSKEKFKELLADENPKVVALDIKFYGGLDVVLPSSLPELEGFYNFLEENSSLKILIRGHVCCMDDFVLSEKRATAVYNYLISRGINATRLNYKGFSNTLPVASPELTEEDKQKNRRVDVEIMK